MCLPPSLTIWARAPWSFEVPTTYTRKTSARSVSCLSCCFVGIKVLHQITIPLRMGGCVAVGETVSEMERSIAFTNANLWIFLTLYLFTPLSTSSDAIVGVTICVKCATWWNPICRLILFLCYWTVNIICKIWFARSCYKIRIIDCCWINVHVHVCVF